MKVTDKLSHLLGNRSRLASDIENHLLSPAEIRLITDGNPEKLADIVASSRLHAADPKGDTPLHIAARIGNLALCDLFVRSGADAGALNHERQTPAEVAFAEGHDYVAQLLSSLVANSPRHETDYKHEERKELENVETATFPSQNITEDQQTSSYDKPNDLDELLKFEVEEEPQEFVDQSTSKTTSGTFVALVHPAPVVSDNGDGEWDLDLSPAPIAGEGIGSGATITNDHGTEHDFLKVRSRGPQSTKRAVIQTGTRLSIDPETCNTWAEEILAKGFFSPEDIEGMIAVCEGNGDPVELRINLKHNLEAAGIEIADFTDGQRIGLFRTQSEISSFDLAEAIEAVLTRSTPLPGTQRFEMSKSDELRLLEPMVRAKQELQLGILACEAAVETICDVFDKIRDGVRDPGSVSLRTLRPNRPDHTETARIFASVESLSSWQFDGRVMHGRRRREALAALEALDLSQSFHKELVCSLERHPSSLDHASRLNALISVFEDTDDRLIREHLPYVRRFAARNVEDYEDPEDLFQVAFIGLQQSTRRFDPERGYRFRVYATYWMRQAVSRWRADEGASIRVPVHRHENLTKLDRALDRLDVWSNGAVSDNDLAAQLEWTAEEVKLFRGIPREAKYPESIADWESLLPEQEEKNLIDYTETKKIVMDALAELNERQADVIKMRFGIDRDDDMTLEEIGQLYGVTRERIRQIEAKGLDRLSHPGRKRRLQELLGM
jgi:RNA polymerase primary sigma factor